MCDGGISVLLARYRILAETHAAVQQGEPPERDGVDREHVFRPVPRQRVYRRHQYRTRVSLDEMSDTEIVNMYRLNREAIFELYGKIRGEIDSCTARSHAVPRLVKLLCTLQFLATGSFQHVVGACCGVEQSTFSKHLDVVLNALTARFRDYIRFPRSEVELQELKLQFFNIAGFPNVLGAIDCTHVPLVPPSKTESVYRNRKAAYSMNVQAICDAKLRILDAVVRFPGSCHDSYILSHSDIGRNLSNGTYGEGWLLGDAGYGCKTWLLTRNVIERTFGVLKSRFCCLHISGGALLYTPRCAVKTVEWVHAVYS
ncbi:putative nuclease HARBI1 [Microcaecilia unicolor]|uniref:Putative nuclease HARBI1 n=1 Tax=Microcaecilia unicolor TaxID=1415580 RepID=A0A6P7XI27_9AMPH|nr:putative nuclease HARBI1 [Microcaecilia unicolor]